MATIGIVYGTGEGQTAKVADRLASAMTERGHEVEALDVETDSVDLDGVDAVVVGSSIHVGKHNAAVVRFLEDEAKRLSALPTAFFQVSLSSATDDPARRAEAAAYVERLLEATSYEPDRIGLFGGALRYSEYGFLKRALLKRIAAEATGDTDTARDYEYTDWDAVEAFADDVCGFVEDRLGDRSG
ncbi:MAG: flavodoxin domain-containing protein [Halobacteriales archaeon]